MALVIDNPETERIARELAERNGETVDQTIANAVAALLEKQKRRLDKDALLAETKRIQAELKALPVLDDRAPDQILGYDENGLPS